MPRAHIALLGDSIFDNGAYTRGEPDVVMHLRRLLPEGWQATSCAMDGATTRDIPAQVRLLPQGATHLVVSIGGNDALRHVNLLSSRVSTMVEALGSFTPHVDRFQHDYRSAIDRVVQTGRPVTVCTIYNGNLDPQVADAARMALALFNDVILRSAAALKLDVIELRDTCHAASDYANPIEPSGAGGLKIAKAILAALREQRS